MKILRAAMIGIALAAGAVPVMAQQPPIPLIRTPQDAGQLNATLNRLIGEINAILTTAFPPVSGAINFISMSPSAAGGLATIGLAPGGDADASIGLTSAGNGDIVLFAGNTQSTGVLQFANSAAFVPAAGLGACPGVNPAAPPFGVSSAITGYVPFKDWLGVMRAFPAC